MVQRKVIVRGATDQALDELDAADIPDLSGAYEAAGGIATHAADSTAVHGITDTAALVIDGDAAGGELAGTYPNPTVAATHSGSAHHAAVTVGTGLDVTGQLVELDLSEVAAGGELGGFMDAPTVDATHSGSTHAGAAAAAVTTHEGLADPHTGYRLESADHSHASTGLQAGTIAHTALTSVGIDDHHARDHAINGSTHTGTLDDAQIPAGITRDAEAAAAYQPIDSDLTAIAALTTTAFGRGLLALADAAALAAAHTHSGSSTAYAPGSFTVATGNYAAMVKRLQLTTTQRATIAGTGRLRID